MRLELLRRMVSMGIFAIIFRSNVRNPYSLKFLGGEKHMRE